MNIICESPPSPSNNVAKILSRRTTNIVLGGGGGGGGVGNFLKSNFHNIFLHENDDV